MSSRETNPLTRLTAIAITFLVLLAMTADDTHAHEGHEEGESVIMTLSHVGESHPFPSLSELEAMAGGEDKLVALLLESRTKDSPPQLGIRAQKVLIRYSHREDVRAALVEDVNSQQYLGLARTVGLHLDKAPSAQARQALASAVLSRAARDKSFMVFARELQNSEDAEVQRMAREALANE